MGKELIAAPWSFVPPRPPYPPSRTTIDIIYGGCSVGKVTGEFEWYIVMCEKLWLVPHKHLSERPDFRNARMQVSAVHCPRYSRGTKWLRRWLRQGVSRSEYWLKGGEVQKRRTQAGSRLGDAVDPESSTATSILSSGPAVKCPACCGRGGG